MSPARLALRVLRFDRRTRTSALLTAAGVAVATALVLLLTALPHAAQVRSERASWQGGHAGISATGGVELASQDAVRGELITRLDVAGTTGGGDRPRYPGAGEVLLSPALAAKAAQLPDERLADRFPGRVAGVLHERYLRFPEQLVAVVGHAPGALDEAAQARAGTAVLLRLHAQNQDQMLQVLAWMGVVILAAPSLVLVASAARLTAARRERRMAALQLAGATPRQVVSTVAAETGLAAVAGTVLGVLLTWPLRYLIAAVPWGGGTWFVADVTPSPWAVLGALAGIPALVAASSVVATWRVVRSPFSAAAEQGRKRPRVWRLGIIAVVAALFGYGLSTYEETGGIVFLLAGLAAIVWSFSLIGPWVTASIGRLFVRAWRRPAVLLAGRRLVSDPKAAYRATSGMVLAVFLGSLALSVLPALGAESGPTDGIAKEGALQAEVPSGQAAELLRRVDDELARTGTRATTGTREEAELLLPGGATTTAQIMDCQAARELTEFGVGSCDGPPALHPPQGADLPASGVRITAISAEDVPALPIPAGTPIRPLAAGGEADRSVLAEPGAVPAPPGSRTAELIVLPATEADREQAQTALARVVAGADIDSAETSLLPARVQNGDWNRITVLGLSIAALLAGGSAAITAAGSVLDRRRTFGALLAAGTPIGTLGRALRTEAALPALVAAGTATAAGFATAAGLLNLTGESPVLSTALLVPCGLGVVVAVLAAATSGPVLRRISAEPLADE